MARLSDVVGARAEKGIDALPLPLDTKAKITWELMPGVLQRGDGLIFNFVLVLCVPVPFTDDEFEAPFTQLPDANPTQEQVSELVRELYAEAQRNWTARSAPNPARPYPPAGVSAEDAMRRSPGGLFMS